MSFKDKFLAAYRSDRVLLGEWIIAIATAVFLFVSVAYVDMISLTVWSTNVWDVTFGSNIRHLYEYTAQNVYGIRHTYMGSELFSVLPWSIWNLPIWAVQKFAGIPIAESPLMLAWSKLFLVGLSGVLLYYTKKITLLVTGDGKKATWAVFLSASSLFLYLGVFYAGQNDIIMLVPFVIGLYSLLRGRERGFLVWSMIAIAIKPFVLLPFLAVLLLYEKKIVKAVLKTLFSVIGVVVQKLLFMGAPLYKESISEGPSREMMEEMFSDNMTTAFGKVSFLAIALVLIYIYCYSRRFGKEDMQRQNRLFTQYAVYMVTVTNMAYLMFSPFTFYRLAILVPFLYIVMVQNTQIPFYNIMLETAMSGSLLVKLGIRGSSSLFRSKIFNGSLLQPLFGYTTLQDKEGAYESLEAYLKSNGSMLLQFQPLFAGVALVCGVLLLLWNHPEKQWKRPQHLGTKNCRWVLWARTVMPVPFVLAVLYLFIKAPIKIY